MHLDFNKGSISSNFVCRKLRYPCQQFFPITRYTFQGLKYFKLTVEFFFTLNSQENRWWIAFLALLFVELYRHFAGPIQAAVRHRTYQDWLVCNVSKGWVFCKKTPTSHLHQRQHEKLNYCKGKGASVEMMLPHHESWISLCWMTSNSKTMKILERILI